MVLSRKSDDHLAMTKRFSWDPPFRKSAKLDTYPVEAAPDNGLGAVLRVVRPVDEIDDEVAPVRQDPAKDWSRLIDRIQEAARYTRQVETEAQEQEKRVQLLLDQARQELKTASERVRAAEARAVEVEGRCEAQLGDAVARVKAAEERARVCEELLAQVSDAVLIEFPVEQVAP